MADRNMILEDLSLEGWSNKYLVDPIIANKKRPFTYTTNIGS